MLRRACGRPDSRRAVAAVEFAFLAPLLFLLLLGLWQVGRVVEVKQLMDNAAREGARIASQAQTINLTGAPIQIHTSSGIPNVRDTVRDYLMAAGVVNATTVNDIQVNFAFTSGDTSRTDPYQGNQGDTFTVTVQLPAQDVNWTPLPINTVTTLYSQVTWTILIDLPFTVNTTVPGWSPASP
jgi:Flp pilus assembly protein TadG